MSLTIKTALVTVGACAVTWASVGVAGVSASADPAPPPWAPRKPAEVWHDQPVVWAQLPAGGHWGVWINGGFIPLT